MQIQLYYSIVFVSALYFFFRSGINRISFLVFLIFWEGLFSFLRETDLIIWNSYKIFFFIYIVLFFLSSISNYNFVKERRLNITYLLFSISFLITFSINDGNYFTIASQFFFKYSTLFILFYLIKELLTVKYIQDYLLKTITIASFIQIILSAVKIIILGFMEQNVGSVEYGSGGTAVILPIVILIYFSTIEIHKEIRYGKLLYILPLFIAIASFKRTPIFLYPIYYFLMSLRFEKMIFTRRTIQYFVMVFMLFYLGVKLNPSLNPEHKIWGTFDFNYVTDYGLTYSFGTSDLNHISNESSSSGRGGSLLMFFEPAKIGIKNTSDLFFGRGLMDSALKLEGRFIGGANYGIQHTGLMSAAIILFYSLGLMGLLFFFLLTISILNKAKNNYLRWVLISLYLYEFLFYGNLMMVNHASSLLVLFVINYSNTGLIESTQKVEK